MPDTRILPSVAVRVMNSSRKSAKWGFDSPLPARPHRQPRRSRASRSCPEEPIQVRGVEDGPVSVEVPELLGAPSAEAGEQGLAEEAHREEGVPIGPGADVKLPLLVSRCAWGRHRSTVATETTMRGRISEDRTPRNRCPV
jgi:hypothetical protein